MTVEEIGSIIHTERIRKGLSCRELAELSNTSAATVSRLETGKRKGSTKAALKVLKALGIELEITEEKTAESITDPNSLYSKIESAIKSSTGGMSMDEEVIFVRQKQIGEIILNNLFSEDTNSFFENCRFSSDRMAFMQGMSYAVILCTAKLDQYPAVIVHEPPEEE